MMLSGFLTLIVSNGCPDTTVQIPPKPPAKKFFTSLVRCFSVMVKLKIGQVRVAEGGKAKQPLVEWQGGKEGTMALGAK